MIAPLEAPYDHLRIHADSEVEKTLRVTAVSKEPETVEWIESMQPGEVLYDIGANVGCYSLIAASRGLRVIAFEPASFNVHALLRNVAINGLTTIWVLDEALGDAEGTCAFRWSSTDAGAASHEMTAGTQVPITTLDSLPSRAVNGRSRGPDHLKIDVDGSELKVVRGGEQTLTKIKSIQIEIDDSIDGWEEIPERMKLAGLTEVKWTRHGTGPISNVLYRR